MRASQKRKSAIYQGLLLLVLTGCIVAYCLLVHGPSEKTVMTRIFVGIASISLIFCAVVLYSRARFLRRQHTNRAVYFVTGRVVNSNSCIALPCSESFWNPSMNKAEECNICSICLGEAIVSSQDETSTGKSACCGSLFHKNCTHEYWKSIGEVRCPNCRFQLLAPMPSQSVSMEEVDDQAAPLPRHSGGRRRTVRRSLFFVSMLIMLICVFTVLGVSQIMELGSATFFTVVAAGVLVLLSFFCALIAYARAKLISVQNLNAPSGPHSLPVFYYLQTIHRPIPVDPVPDEEYWLKTKTTGPASIESKEPEQCPICLCDMRPSKSPTRVSACCKRQIHVKCAQQYFNTVRQIKCVFCRKELTPEVPASRITQCPDPSPSRNPTASDV